MKRFNRSPSRTIIETCCWGDQMSDEPIDVVVYCDGTPGSDTGNRTPPKPHAEHPIAAYRLVAGGWLSLQYGTFADGLVFMLPTVLSLPDTGQPFG
jgi:hypothetical protein